jgi:lambda repressor-like predicted transcriptional regulator
VADAFGVDPGTIWRWDQALAAAGVAGLIPARRGPKGASKLTPQLVERIAGLDAAGATLREIAAATGVSTFSVRNALGRVAPGGRPAATGDSAGLDAGGGDPGQGAVAVLPDPVPRDGGAGAGPVGAAG